MGDRRKAHVYEKHQRRWATWARRGEIPEDDNNDLFADWNADAEVSDLLIARWERTVWRRVSPQGGRTAGRALRS